jgi:hypothetical protein
MPEGFISTIAHVECRSEGRGDEIPVAVVFGDGRFKVTAITDQAMVTSIEAGEPVRQRFWVELEDRRRCELTREIPDGTWRVKVAR